MRRRTPAILAAVVALGLLVGCGGGSDVDLSKVQSQIKRGYNKQSAGEGIRATKVQCVEQKNGDGAQCIATVKAAAGGPSSKVGITVTYGDNGSLLWKTDF